MIKAWEFNKKNVSNNSKAYESFGEQRIAKIM